MIPLTSATQTGSNAPPQQQPRQGTHRSADEVHGLVVDKVHVVGPLEVKAGPCRGRLWKLRDDRFVQVLEDLLLKVLQVGDVRLALFVQATVRTAVVAAEAELVVLDVLAARDSTTSKRPRHHEASNTAPPSLHRQRSDS